jgi:hypothetical protein
LCLQHNKKLLEAEDIWSSAHVRDEDLQDTDAKHVSVHTGVVISANIIIKKHVLVCEVLPSLTAFIAALRSSVKSDY